MANKILVKRGLSSTRPIADEGELMFTTDTHVLSIGTGSANIDLQNALDSGVNIKTINNQSIVGAGNVTISGGISEDDAFFLALIL